MKNCLNFNCEIDIVDNPLNLDLNDFLDIGIRNNRKRRFLFISKKLGKHLACKPSEMDNLGKLMATIYNKKNKVASNGTVIAFAETGTAVGHSFFDYLSGDYEFIHTTREQFDELENLDFLEEHSHATDQNLYFEMLDNFKFGDEVILVDDEITTANTCMNIIRKIQSIYPKKKYTICSILNWVSDENLKKISSLEKELGCKIEFVYLFKGDFNFDINEDIVANYNDNCTISQSSIMKDDKINLIVNHVNVDLEDYIGNKKYIRYTGRFGINKREQIKLKEIVKRESKKIVIESKESLKKKAEKVLFLGTEEFMYIPMLFAKEKENQCDIYYHSTTRSPIINIDKNNYPIRSKFKLKSFYNSDVQNYIYNIDRHDFSECYLFVELDKSENSYLEFIDIIKKTSIKKLTIVCCS
ncbi:MULTISPECIES: phosphoribosyltransferase family protein [unclassified Clostridioides]|uniref:phosphoribosyltransferase family protein n=1 Tax=unclassified Clostridioides TaxID=2635829 RepID=UPI001D1242EE|nr:phosphoribosyltransferase family protein [Clostridioides sp. ZZV14-6150]MCC0722184.1 phosphoribosyltransferase family protein [Clostridioides sp. ZZV14-6104]MCC0725067.1 phosphoribosyltransferase family protein [Clostridioides sp. ZZV14-6045]MCC0732090.1 phosphoribosyltransferase family protein [Clostridioides sp. ZZV14-6048]MCC0738865.1 phosphoribosyltransferase family protein [Clostridioides sp. ZZV14-5902]MCC0744075.1 phosphoribosyltransferase family protein [Clostridioides sp. ZZV14-604